MKKEIIFCTDSLNIGGIELALIRILKALVKTNEFNIKLCIKDDEKLELLPEIPEEIEYIILNKKNDKKFIFNFIKKIIERKRFFNFIKTSDVVIDYYDGNWFKFFSNINKQKKIVFFHTILEKLYIYKRIDIVKSIYDEYIVFTDGAKKELLNIGISESKIKKIYNIIPFDDILRKSEERFEKKEEYFIMIGRLVNDSKDYLTVIEAFASSEIKEKRYIVGDGPYKSQIETQIKELNLESKIKLLGSKKNPYPILKNSKGLILSSKYEGLSNVILEALVLEKPVIATNCPYGPKEIIGGERNIGILFTTGDKKELIDILKDFDFKGFNMLKMKNRVKDFSEENILKEVMESLIKKEIC